MRRRDIYAQRETETEGSKDGDTILELCLRTSLFAYIKKDIGANETSGCPLSFATLHGILAQFV